MKRRWFICGIFIALLTLVVGGWATSAWYACGAYFRCGERGMGVQCIECDSVDLYFARTFNHGLLFGTDPYYAFAVRHPYVHPGTRKDGYWFIGFGYKSTFLKADGGIGRIIFKDWTFTIPYWFLTLLSATALWFVWWKTREQIDPRTAFPVELNPPTPQVACKHAG